MTVRTPGSRGRRWGIALLRLAAIAISTGLLLRRRTPDRERSAVELHHRGGEVMARLVREALPDGGRILLVVPAIDAEANPDHAEWFAAMLAAFERRLPAAIAVAGRETVRLAPDRRGRATPQGALTAAFLRQALERSGGADAIVSFAGAPRDPDIDGLPRMVCFSPSGDDLPARMADGLVVSAVAPRRTAVPIGTRGNWFDIMYEVVTPDSVRTWD